MSGEEDRSYNFSNNSYVSDTSAISLSSEIKGQRKASDQTHRSSVHRNQSDASGDSFFSTRLPHILDHDTDGGFSGQPTPDLNIESRSSASPKPSRKTSLRFRLPDSLSASTPPTTSSSAASSKLHHHNKFGSPFMDENVIMENEIYDGSRPQSPHFPDDIIYTTDLEPHSSSSKDSDIGSSALERKESTMKRHRWGTTRNKKGRPMKEKVNRSKTLKKILRHPSHSHRSTDRNNSVIRKPSSAESIIDDYDTDRDEDDNDEEEGDPADRKSEKRTVVFNRVLKNELLDPETGKPLTNYPRNKIRTTKYTPLSFLPKNITNQFLHNVANIYFLAVIILGAFGIFGVPSPVLSAVPLICIVIITAIKDAIEDSRRTVSDLEVNNQITHILTQVSDSDTGYVYENANINDEKISLWRQFKKANSRLLFKTIDKINTNFTKQGRARKERERFNEENNNPEHNNKKSFDSDLNDYRNSLEDPFRDRVRKSFQLHRGSKQFDRHRTMKFAKKYWKDVKVGDVLRIYNNDEIPADVAILSTSDEDGCCYVETKNLDGETNLKVRQALKYGSVEHEIKKADDLMARSFEIESEGPHPNLYSYEGNLRYGDDGEQQEAITINNLLLRGCSLRNTKWVIGVVVFTGSDTKIMINAGVTPTKQSRISRELNYYVYLNFILLFLLCFVSGLVNGIYYRSNHVSRDFYEFGTIAGTPALNGLVSFFVAVILYQSLVPISLYITIEIIKTAQAFFIYSDIRMYYEPLDYPCTPKSWNISDDLGQIEYVFSDKTGTLTQNIMEFKKCTINGVSYGRAYTEALAGLRKRQGVDVDTEAATEKELIGKDKEEMMSILDDISQSTKSYHDELTFVSSEFAKALKGSQGEEQKHANEHFMLVLALCHSVLTEADPKNDDKMLLKAQSPDEAALVGTARAVGFAFTGNTKKGVLVDFQGESKNYQVLNTLEFNSTRKRMSAIIKVPPENPGGEPKAILMCKGADSVIYNRLSKSNDRTLLNQTAKHLEEFATEGLRTLCIAQRELTWTQYTEWNKRHQAAASSLDNREEKMEEVADSVERELILLGGTAIEDRLQDGVPDSISILGQAGIKLWVLTGDKVETAINIGFSCNLLANEMELLILKCHLSKEESMKVEIMEELLESELVNRLVTYYLSKHFGNNGTVEELDEAMDDHTPPSDGYGVVIDGDALKIVLSDPDTRRKFLLLCKHCKAVLCCRVSPAQKAAVVKLVKDSLDVMTLAIGDGSNDVAMIQAADVGVGIAGEEGRQAAMSSDYAVGQFRYLVRLLLVHGRWSYKRFSEMIPSFFYKNVIFSLALFWYGIYNDFDGSYLFEYTYLMFYNLAFTSLPIIFLAVFDQDTSAKVSLLVPQLYRTGITRSEWTQTKFWWYTIDATYQSVISFFFPYLMYYKSFQGMNGLPIDHRFWIGIVVTCISCIACNLYILLHQYRWDWLSSLIVALSILIIYTWTGLWTTSTYSQEFYKAAPQMFGSTGFWACSFIGVIVCLLPRVTYDFLQKVIFPKDIDLIRECVNRGDFDAYPENYDPTDPNRPKISEYSNEVVKRISMNQNRSESTVFSKDIASNNKADPENLKSPAKTYQRYVPPSSPSISSPRSTSFTGTQKSPQRNSIINIFKRKHKVPSTYYDNNHDFIDAYNLSNDTMDDLNGTLHTEEIAMEDFAANYERASRISDENHRRLSGNITPTQLSPTHRK
ncbi:uncharacterized protein PRCAT00006051001 [Priceomyces carsonii]|uniref:uncharacterized protein n=1 Tax=Priceomyces carsonii TaxID=28549 RepID=UPI002ED97CB1|nr:unnamed protein product [Priceomyces carsonii]